jgi:acetoin utilization protein AcuB
MAESAAAGAAPAGAHPDGPIVADVMSKPVLAAAPSTTVGEARRLMREAWIRHLPVVEGDLLVGIVSDRDLAAALGDEVSLGAVMTRTVFVAFPEMPLRAAARLLVERRFDALPVLEGRRLVGILSAVDLMRVLGERPRSRSSP